MIRVSVVIPAYDRAASVCEAIDSVLTQTRKADEIMVVDDGSTDDTAQRLTTVRDCDQINLLEHGKVDAKGSFDELVKASEPFRGMLNSRG